MLLSFVRNQGLTFGWVPFSFLLACGGVSASAVAPAPPAEQGDAVVREISAFSTSSSEICFNGIDDNQNRLLDEGCDVRQGAVQFLLAWPESTADLDLYATDPYGQIATTSGATRAGLNRSADCPLAESDCHEQSYENVYGELDEVHAGKYELRVRLEKLPANAVTLQATLGVRLPQGTRAFELEFSRLGQEALLVFEIGEEFDSTEDKD